MNRFHKKDAFAFGWETFKQHPLFLIGLTLLLWIVSGGFGISSELFISLNLELGSFIVTLLSIAASILLAMGLIYIGLKFYDKEQPSIKDLLAPARYFWSYVGASVLYGLIVFGGLLLLIVPGIMWAIKYSMYRYLIIDRGLDVFGSLKESGNITSGSKWNLLWFFILIGLLNMVGALLLVVGLLVTIPVSLLAIIYVYRNLAQGAPSSENSITSTSEARAEESSEKNANSI